jgi:hypothetical protein
MVQGPNVWTSFDGGANWTSQLVGTAANGFFDVAALSPKTVLVTGRAGGSFVTHDSGATWTNIGSGLGYWAYTYSIGASDPLGAVIGGEGQASSHTTAGTSIPDYGGANTWSGTGPTMFAACLRSVSGVGVSETWTINAGNTCPTTDGAYWNAVVPTGGTAGAKVAQSTASTTVNAVANLRFGIKIGLTQTPGTYYAPLVFEVVAPNA